jgi:uncharacterized membrane protein
LARALGADRKGIASLALYTLAVGLAFIAPVVSCVIYAVVAVMWFVPDRRIEKALAAD